jgi:XTP/dITP diphosphohydrolase
VRARLCSRNEHKLRELGASLPGWELALLGVDEFPPEEGASHYENALAKARFGREVGSADESMLGEDSGLHVDALDGRPGVHSARWSADPITDLLRELDGVVDRRARYVCELVCLSPAGEEVRATGMLAGRIGDDPRGTEGFGYDPIFVPDGEHRTVAELGNAWKSVHSPRAHAARALAAAVAARARA